MQRQRSRAADANRRTPATVCNVMPPAPEKPCGTSAAACGDRRWRRAATRHVTIGIRRTSAALRTSPWRCATQPRGLERDVRTANDDRAPAICATAISESLGNSAEAATVTREKRAAPTGKRDPAPGRRGTSRTDAARRGPRLDLWRDNQMPWSPKREESRVGYRERSWTTRAGDEGEGVERPRRSIARPRK